MRRAAGFRSQPPDHSPESVSISSRCSGDHVRLRQSASKVESVRFGFEATPSLSEAGVSLTGPPLPERRPRQMPSLLAESWALPFDMHVLLRLRRN
eukprot:5985670-Pleurochrysis_carterae.AAC.1